MKTVKSNSFANNALQRQRDGEKIKTKMKNLDFVEVCNLP